MTEKLEAGFARVSEVVKVLGVKKDTVYRLIRLGKVPSVRVGKLHLVPRSWLDEVKKIGEGGTTI